MNGAKRRAEAIRPKSALTLSHYPRSSVRLPFSSGSLLPALGVSSKPAAGLSAPRTAPGSGLTSSPETVPEPAPPLSDSSGNSAFWRTILVQLLPPSKIKLRIENYAEVHAAGACSRPIFGVPRGLRAAPRSHHAAPGVRLRKPRAQPGPQPHRGTTGFGETAVRLR